MSVEVAEPILNSPYEEPAEHFWGIHEGLEPERRQGRRLPVYYLETDKRVEAFVKNAGMGFAIGRRTLASSVPSPPFTKSHQTSCQNMAMLVAASCMMARLMFQKRCSSQKPLSPRMSSRDTCLV